MENPRPFEFSHTSIDEGKYSTKDYERGRVKAIEELIPCGRARSAIDIGCGPGYFCKALNDKGWSVLGVDTDLENIRSAGRFATETRVGDAISVLSELPEAHADLVLALELIEHMPKEYGERLLHEARRVLKTGGELLLSTPNRHSPEGLGGYYWGEKVRRWGKWMAWDETHVHIYTSQEIRRLLRRCGFVVERMTGYWYEGRLPLVGRWGLPLLRSSSYPFNRFGFNIILVCRSA